MDTFLAMSSLCLTGGRASRRAHPPPAQDDTRLHRHLLQGLHNTWSLKLGGLYVHS